MWTTLESPAGPMRVVAQDDAITSFEFAGGDNASGAPRSSTAVASARAAGLPVGERDDHDPLLREAVRQMAAYFARELTEFDLPVRPDGTPFQKRVWAQLQQIDYGETVSYGELALRMGLTPASARAVGLANGRNPIAIVIPCHRVIGAGGRLVGYAGGLERKQMLLELEQDALF